MTILAQLSRGGTLDVFSMMPKEEPLRQEYQKFKTQSIVRAFKLVTAAGFVILILFAMYALVTQTKHSYLTLLKHIFDCICWVCILLLQRRWKNSVGYLAGITLLSHFVIYSYYMTLAEQGKFGLTRIDVLLTHELTFFLYISYSLLLSPSLLWSILFYGPIYVIGSTIYDYTDFGYRETFLQNWWLTAGYRIILVLAASYTHWIALEREISIFLIQQAQLK